MKKQGLSRIERREWIVTLRRQLGDGITSEQIAEFVGTTKEGVNRVLGRAINKDPSLRIRPRRSDSPEMREAEERLRKLQHMGIGITEEERTRVLNDIRQSGMQEVTRVRHRPRNHRGGRSMLSSKELEEREERKRNL